MKRLVIVAVACAALGVVVAGCETTGVKTDGTKVSGGCGCPGTAGDFCKSCNAVKGASGEVHCATCDKTFKAGSYCKGCNAFLFAEKAQCGSCGEKPKGKYCAKCDGYAGLPNVGYCEGCKAPHSKTKGCGCCK